MAADICPGTVAGGADSFFNLTRRPSDAGVPSGSADAAAGRAAPAVEVVDLCGTSDDEEGDGGANAHAPLQADDEDDEVMILEASDYAPEVLSRWDSESRQRRQRRQQRRAAAANTRAYPHTSPAWSQFSEAAECHSGEQYAAGRAAQAHGDPHWDSVAADWRRKNMTAVPEEHESAGKRVRSPAAQSWPSWQNGAMGGHPHGAGMATQDTRGAGACAAGDPHADKPADAYAKEQDELRSRLSAELQHRCRGCVSLGSVLHVLGFTPDGWPLSTETQLRAAYRAAALKFHPDRSKEGDPAESRIWNEEAFKHLAAVKDRI